jgi:predicted SAM-dependent methyltransferase
MNKLNIGSGEDYREGWINMDIRDNLKVDVVHDFNIFPYPFPSGFFNEVEMRMVLEHTDYPIKTLKELCRICKKRARIHLTVPHAFSYANHSDLQHNNSFTEHTFSEWHLIEYGLDQLRLIKITFSWDYRYKKYVPFKKYLKIYFNGIYDNIHFELEVVK